MSKPCAANDNHPRHHHLQHDLAPLLEWRSMTAMAETSGDSTWLQPDPTVTGYIDDDGEVVGPLYHAELDRTISPTLEQLLEAVEGIQRRVVRERGLDRNGNRIWRKRVLLVGPEVEHDDEGRIYRAGGLREIGEGEERQLQIAARGRWFFENERIRFRRAPRKAATVGHTADESLDSLDRARHARDFDRLRERLGWRHVLVLDQALEAANFQQVGEALGYRGKHAERQGREALLAACAALRRELGRKQLAA